MPGNLISFLQHPDGATDGVDKYPVYSVHPTSRLSYTIDKLLASMSSTSPGSLPCSPRLIANAHRLFLSDDDLPSPGGGGGVLTGVVSIIDSTLSFLLRKFGLLDGHIQFCPSLLALRRSRTLTLGG